MRRIGHFPRSCMRMNPEICVQLRAGERRSQIGWGVVDACWTAVGRGRLAALNAEHVGCYAARLWRLPSLSPSLPSLLPALSSSHSSVPGASNLVLRRKLKQRNNDKMPREIVTVQLGQCGNQSAPISAFACAPIEI